jgi:hypothetical protein
MKADSRDAGFARGGDQVSLARCHAAHESARSLSTGDE